MIGRAVVAAAFLAYLVGQAPHLVHHLFEADDLQADCAFLASADRQHAMSADPAPALSAAAGVSSIAPRPEPSPIARDSGSAGARAPPSIA